MFCYRSGSDYLTTGGKKLVPYDFPTQTVYIFFFYLPVSLQSVRGQSAIVFDGHY